MAYRYTTSLHTSIMVYLVGLLLIMSANTNCQMWWTYHILRLLHMSIEIICY